MRSDVEETRAVHAELAAAQSALYALHARFKGGEPLDRDEFDAVRQRLERAYAAFDFFPPDCRLSPGDLLSPEQ